MIEYPSSFTEEQQEVGVTNEIRRFSGTETERHITASVIIPVYNCAATLAAQLKALRNQACDIPWEVVVVDNGSTDGTQRLVEQYQETMTNLRLVHAREKRSTSHGRNVGASKARGDVLLFCDGDDIVAPGWLCAMVRALGRHEFVVGRVEVATLNPGVPEKYGNNGLNDKAYHFLPYAIGCTMGVTRRAFESVGGFSTMCTKCMDVDLSWRLQLAGFTLHEAPEAEVYYRYRTTAWSHWKTALSFSQAHVALYKRFAVHGAKRSPTGRALRRYKKVLSGLPKIGRMTQRERIVWASELGVSLGRIWGSLRYRTLYL